MFRLTWMTATFANCKNIRLTSQALVIVDKTSLFSVSKILTDLELLEERVSKRVDVIERMNSLDHAILLGTNTCIDSLETPRPNQGHPMRR